MGIFSAITIACIAFWIAAITLTRQRKRKMSVQRVTVQAVVNYYSRNGGRNRAPQVVFDYPLPSGQWHRVQHTVVLNPTPERGFFEHMKPGDTFPIYVNPQEPYDIFLGSKFDITTTRMYTCYFLASAMTIMVVSNLLRLTLN